MKRELAILSRGGKNISYFSLFKKRCRTCGARLGSRDSPREVAAPYIWLLTHPFQTPQYDIDGSGTMDFSELSTIVRREMRMPAKEVSDEALRLVWAAMDEDRSGLVNVQECLSAKSRAR